MTDQPADSQRVVRPCRGIEIAPGEYSGCRALEMGWTDCPTCRGSGDEARPAPEPADEQRVTDEIMRQFQKAQRAGEVGRVLVDEMRQTLAALRVTDDGPHDGTERLCHAVYERGAKAGDFLGGSNAQMLHDAADKIAALRAEVERLGGELARRRIEDEHACKKIGDLRDQRDDIRDTLAERDAEIERLRERIDAQAEASVARRTRLARADALLRWWMVPTVPDEFEERQALYADTAAHLSDAGGGEGADGNDGG